MNSYNLSRSDHQIVQRLIKDYRTKRQKVTPQRRRRSSASGATPGSNPIHFQVIRGVMYGGIETKYAFGTPARYIEMDTIVEFEQHAKLPDEPVRVLLADSGDTDPSDGDLVWAVYHEKIAVVEDEVNKGTIQGIDGDTVILDSTTADDEEGAYNGMSLEILDGPGVGQIVAITDYSGENHTASISPSWEEGQIPQTGNAYRIYTTLNIDWAKLPAGMGADVKIVHIDEDITGVEEITDENDDPIENDGLILFAYARTIKDLKYYVKAESEILSEGVVADSGITSNTIILDSSASSIPNDYVDCVIRITDGVDAGDKVTVTSYDGPNREATVSPNWAINPEPGDGYSLSRDDPGYDPDKEVMILAYDDQGTESEYLTIPIYYDDGKDFKVGEYTRKDYPDYPDTEVFPPDGTGTYQEETDPNFFKKRYRGIAVERVLVTALCQQLPPPKLTEVSS